MKDHLAGLRVACPVVWVGGWREAGLLTMWSHVSSSEQVTKGQNSGIKFKLKVKVLNILGAWTSGHSIQCCHHSHHAYGPAALVWCSSINTVLQHFVMVFSAVLTNSFFPISCWALQWSPCQYGCLRIQPFMSVWLTMKPTTTRDYTSSLQWDCSCLLWASLAAVEHTGSRHACWWRYV